MVFFICPVDALHPLDNATYTLHVLTCQIKKFTFLIFFAIVIKPAYLLAILSFTGLFCVRGYHGFKSVSRKKRQEAKKVLIVSVYAVLSENSKKKCVKNLTGKNSVIYLHS